MDQATGREGSGASHLTFLLTCARAAIPFVAQAALTAVASAAHGLGCARWSTHRLQLCPPGPTPHIQVSGCPPRPPSTSLQLGHALVCAGIQVCRVGTSTGPTHPAAPHSVAQSSPHHRSRSQSPPGPHRSGHGRYSCRLGRGTGRMVAAHGPCGLGSKIEQGRAGQLTLAKGPKGAWGTEFTCHPGKPRMAPTLPAAAHAVHTRTVAITGAAGTPRAS